MLSRFSFLLKTTANSQPFASIRTMTTDTNEHRYETHPHIVWVDCEMTGLNVNVDTLLEVALVLTNSSLDILSSIGPLIINTQPEALNNMNDWCKKNHKKSGLVEACLSSKLTLEDVDSQLYEFMNSKLIKRAALAGNSIGYDRQFLEKYCPKFMSSIHYRNIDVSSFKEMIRSKKKYLHLIACKTN